MEARFFEELVFKDLSYGFNPTQPLFTDLRLKFPLDQVTWIYGGAGVGKSIFLRILGGLMSPTKGDYLINGTPVQKMTFEEFLPIRLKIGFAFDQGGLLANKTLYDNLALPLQYHRQLSDEQVRERVKEYLEIFKLTPVASERPSAVARGHQKSAILARVLIMRPELLILDDPTGGLSRDHKTFLRDIIEKHKTTHNLRNIFVASEDYKFLENFINQRIEIVAQTLFINGRAPEDIGLGVPA